MPALAKASGVKERMEIGVFDIKRKQYKSGYLGDHLDVMNALLTVPAGKSIRIGYQDLAHARSYINSLNGFLKKNKHNTMYFAVAQKTPDEKDGKFYCYIGRRADRE